MQLGDENDLSLLTTRHVWHLVKKYRKMIGVNVHLAHVQILVCHPSRGKWDALVTGANIAGPQQLQHCAGVLQ